MSISIKPSVANQVRALKAASPFLTEADIVKLTGFDRTQVKNALARSPASRRAIEKTGLAVSENIAQNKGG